MAIFAIFSSIAVSKEQIVWKQLQEQAQDEERDREFEYEGI
jgi:hypothetical protein